MNGKFFLQEYLLGALPASQAVKDFVVKKEILF